MNTIASVNYHVVKDEVQFFEFDPDGAVGELISPELVPTKICATDLRRTAARLPTFSSNGVLFTESPSKVSIIPTSEDWEVAYNREVEALLKAKIGAKDVIVFDNTVRIDDPTAMRRPARNVHADYSAEGAEQRLEDVVGESRAKALRTKGYAFVNVWRPLEHTVKSSPLGFIDPQSMDSDDWIDIQLKYPDRLGNILGVAANPGHRWFFMSDMTPDDVAIFNIYDSQGRPQVAHSALDLLSTPASATRRQSIETRTIVSYE
ncbi:MAG: CmcJ/NvfI family oxidoreductase [Pseudomonadota bacterium]